MRTEVRITFNSNNVPGGARAILEPAGCGPDVANVTEVPELAEVEVWVTLPESDPRIPVLRALIERHGVRWLEFHKDRYTEEEIDGARLLIMHPNRQSEICGGVEYGMTYDFSGACPACGTGARQTSAAFVAGDDLAGIEGHRAGASVFFHILLDEGLAEELERIGATGVSFRSVYALMPDKRQIKLRRRQLCAARTLPPMSPQTTGLIRDRACEVCGRNGYFQTRVKPTRLVYRAEDLRDADDVNVTWENLGYAVLKPELRESLLSYPWMLVTPKVRRVFCAAGVASFDWLPIRVEEMAGASLGGERW